MLTILHVIDSLRVGGAEHQLKALLEGSDPSRFRQVLCVLDGASLPTQVLERAGVPVHVFALSLPRDILTAGTRLSRLVGEVRPQVLHATLFYSGVLARTVGRLARIPVVTSLVNTSYEPEWRADNPRITLAKAAFVQGVDGLTARLWGTRFIALTEAVRRSAVRRLGIDPRRISVIPRGVDLQHFQPSETAAAATVRHSLGWDGAYPLLVTVGRLVPQKGHRYAIRAMGDVLRVFPQARLAIAGVGYLREPLEALARELGVDRHVHFLGEWSDVPSLLEAADFFLFPSLFEGFGCALCEAMVMGKPCIVSRVPALAEVTDGGRVVHLVAPRSAGDLAQAIIAQARHPEQAAHLGAQAAAWARPRYDIRRQIRAIEQLYSELVDTPRRAAMESGPDHLWRAAGGEHAGKAG
jgi:glycosyltransferase involved in cell wall biosynthesis